MLPKDKQTPIKKIPEEWEVVRLGDVAIEIKNGFATGKRDGNGIVQIRMNNITTDGRITFDSYIKVPPPKNVEEYILKEGDFLFNNTNSYDLVGKSALFEGAPFPCVYSNHFTRIRFDLGKVEPKFVSYYFVRLWERGYFKSVAIRHVGQAAVNNKYVENLKLPLPPLPEQRRIAKVLSTVDAAIEKTEEMIAHADRLKKGLMQILLTRGIGHERFKDTEIGRIPEEWEVVRLGDVVKKAMNGGTPSTKISEYWDGNIPWIRSVNITTYYLDESMVEKYITQKGVENSATNIIPKENVIIATRVGIGKSAVNLIDVAINQDLTGLIIDKKRSDPFFIVWYLHSSKVQRYLESLSRGTTIKGIPQHNIKNLKLPLPPLEEQKKIAEILGTVDRKLELLRARRERLERVKRGLMNDLLTGRKRVLEGVV